MCRLTLNISTESVVCDDGRGCADHITPDLHHELQKVAMGRYCIDACDVYCDSVECQVRPSLFAPDNMTCNVRMQDDGYFTCTCMRKHGDARQPVCRHILTVLMFAYKLDDRVHYVPRIALPECRTPRMFDDFLVRLSSEHEREIGSYLPGSLKGAAHSPLPRITIQ